MLVNILCLQHLQVNAEHRAFSLRQLSFFLYTHVSGEQGVRGAAGARGRPGATGATGQPGRRKKRQAAGCPGKTLSDSDLRKPTLLSTLPTPTCSHQSINQSEKD